MILTDQSISVLINCWIWETDLRLTFDKMLVDFYTSCYMRFKLSHSSSQFSNAHYSLIFLHLLRDFDQVSQLSWGSDSASK